MLAQIHSFDTGAEAVAGCVWQWCNEPGGCQTANGSVPHQTCMTSRREVYPLDMQECSMTSGAPCSTKILKADSEPVLTTGC